MWCVWTKYMDLLARVRCDGTLQERRKSAPLRVGLHAPNTSPVPTFNAANKFFVPCRT
jgi:hypothetical protein